MRSVALTNAMDDNELIGVYIKRIDMPEPDFFLCEPSIEAYLVDQTSGTCIQANSSDSNIFSYTCPVTLSNQDGCMRSYNWNQLLVIDEKFSNLNSESKIFFFEVCKRVRRRKARESERIRIAWAFLVPLASDGSMNTNTDLNLQLYEVKKNCKVSHQDCNVFHLYKDHKLKKLIGTLQVSVKGVLPNKSKPPEKEEEVKERPTHNEKETVEVPPTRELKSVTKPREWSRLPSQSCKVPNRICKSYSLGKNGISCLRFSRSGVHVAASVLSQIFIHEVVSGVEVIVLNSHIGFIYELDWALDDKYLLSVSNDCRGAIWSLTQKSPLFVLPHPSYVYCGRWFGSNERIVTGGRDHLVRYWCRNGDEFDLIDEIPGHGGFVSALATQDGSLVFSGDSHGCVMIRKFSEDSWVLLKQLSFPEIFKNVIDSIHIHSSHRRVVLSVRRKGSYLVDVVSGIILQTYKSAINTYARCISCMTPCGSLLFSFCQNGDVGVWEVNTGKLVATYDNLIPIDHLSELSGSLHYHPFEHILGVTALGQNYPVLLLKHDMSDKNDSEKLGLKFADKKMEKDLSGPVLISKWSLTSPRSKGE